MERRHGTVRGDRDHQHRDARRPQLSRARRATGPRHRPAARYRPSTGRGGRAWRPGHRRLRDAHTQRLPDRRAGPGAGHRGRTTSVRPMRWPSIACRFATGTSSTSARSCGSGSSPPRDTPSPTCRMRWRPRGGRGRCSPAGRCCTGRQGGRTCSAPLMPPSWRTPSTRRRTAWRPSCRRMRTSIRRTGSAASARPPRPRAPPPPPRPSAGRGGSTRRWSWLSSDTSASCWPGWMPTPPTMRTWGRRTRPALPGPDLNPPHRADASELRRRIEAGEWVVDLRARRAFAAGHLAGTFSFDLTGSFAPYLGWLIPWGTPLTLLGQTPDEVTWAQRELPDRHRPPGRNGGRRPGAVVRRPPATQLRRRRLLRPGRGPPPPPRSDPGCAARPGVGRLPHRRRHPHPPARAAWPTGRGAVRGAVGVLPERVPRHGGRLPAGGGGPDGRRHRR